MASLADETVLTAGAFEGAAPVIPADLLASCSAHHARLCPRQVLGLRIGLLAGEALDLSVPRTDKRLFTIAETSGCAVDGLSVSTGCRQGRNTLRVIDFGKVAATIMDMKTGEAVRIATRAGARQAAGRLFPHAQSRWHAQLEAYQVMPASELLTIQSVHLDISCEELMGRPGHRVLCAACGEEVINGREVVADGRIVCRSCAGESYYCASKHVL